MIRQRPAGKQRENSAAAASRRRRASAEGTCGMGGVVGGDGEGGAEDSVWAGRELFAQLLLRLWRCVSDGVGAESGFPKSTSSLGLDRGLE